MLVQRSEPQGRRFTNFHCYYYCYYYYYYYNRWNRPKVPPPVQIEISNPPASTQLFTITSVTTGSRLTEECSFRVLGGCRETSNVSEFYYSSKRTEGTRELSAVDFFRDHSGLTPVEKVSSEGSKDEASVCLEVEFCVSVCVCVCVCVCV